MDHKPYIRYVPDSHYAVLMVHGIVGTPAQFRDLIPVIEYGGQIVAVGDRFCQMGQLQIEERKS